jgi:rRNA-processing protein FCF1
MKTVLADTNIILWTFSDGPDFREAISKAAPEWNLAIPSCVITELEKLESKDSRAALSMCKPLKIIDIGEGYTDTMLIDAAKNGYLIATNDKEILSELKSLKLNALKIRGKNKLVSTEGI